MNLVKPIFSQEMPRIYSFTYGNTYDLCMSLVRMQEFYESPEFKGMHFTLEEYMDYWSRTHGHGAFTYPAVWGGFNIPGKVLKNWINLFCDDVRPREKELIDIILENVPFHDWDNSYFIFVASNEKNVSDIEEHEVAHGMYGVYKDYKKSCDLLIKGSSVRAVEAAKRKLLKMGYDESVIFDEIQAYWSTSSKKYSKSALSGRATFIKNYEKYRSKDYATESDPIQ